MGRRPAEHVEVVRAVLLHPPAAGQTCQAGERDGGSDGAPTSHSGSLHRESGAGIQSGLVRRRSSRNNSSELHLVKWKVGWN